MTLTICSFCSNDQLGSTDYDMIGDKVQCWRCRYYFLKKDKQGRKFYEQKRIYAGKDSPYLNYLKQNASG